jgi:hypothetical protein
LVTDLAPGLAPEVVDHVGDEPALLEVTRRILTRNGYRVITAGKRDLLLRLSRLADDLPEVTELDPNPVIAGPAR